MPERAYGLERPADIPKGETKSVECKARDHIGCFADYRSIGILGFWCGCKCHDPKPELSEEETLKLNQKAYERWQREHPTR